MKFLTWRKIRYSEQIEFGKGIADVAVIFEVAHCLGSNIQGEETTIRHSGDAVHADFDVIGKYFLHSTEVTDRKCKHISGHRRSRRERHFDAVTGKHRSRFNWLKTKEKTSLLSFDLERS